MPSGAVRSRLAENIVHFARVLRHAGLPVGPGKVLAAIEAVQLVGVERREDVRSALSATLLDRADAHAHVETLNLASLVAIDLDTADELPRQAAHESAASCRVRRWIATVVWMSRP